VPNGILPESLASSPGACQTGCPKQKGIVSGIIIMVIVWQRVSLAAAIIYIREREIVETHLEKYWCFLQIFLKISTILVE
jgi:hypothetical protein